jgi:hypothetical protein
MKKNVFAKVEIDLHPNVVAEIKSWATHPELSKLLSDIESQTKYERFVDHYAEAMIAIYLLNKGCELQYEFPTVNNKSADFRVGNNNNIFFLHIKRINLDNETVNNIKINAQLCVLKKIERPITVFLKRFCSLTSQEMYYCCQEAKAFIENAKEGDIKEIKNNDDEVLVEFEIGPPHRGRHVVFNTILPVIDGVYDKKIDYQLSHAYKRFMSEHTNIILVTSFWGDSASIEDLRDSVENFWLNKKNSCSNIIGAFKLEPQERQLNELTIFCRANYKMPQYITELFHCD